VSSLVTPWERAASTRLNLSLTASDESGNETTKH
jgi:hypothetical protein